MLTKILEIRTAAIEIYRKGRHIINPVIKFMLGLIVFSSINSAIGFDPRFTKTSIVLLLSLVSAVTPGGVMVFLAMALILVHVLAQHIFLAIVIFLFFVVLYAALMRFSSGNSIVAVLIPILAPFNLHFAVPLVLGCTSNPLSIFPCSCGVALYYLIDVIKYAAVKQVDKDLDDVVEFYTDVLDVILGKKEMYVVIIVFAIVIIAVYLLRKIPFDYSFLISIGVGMLISIIGLLVGSFKYGVSISVGAIIFMNLLCAVVAVTADFMKRVLDYTAIEHVQFEDDDFYYYVKAVPKIKISMSNHNIRVLSPSDENFSDMGSDDYDDAKYVSAYSEQAPGYDGYNGYDDRGGHADSYRDDADYADGYEDDYADGYEDGYEDGYDAEYEDDSYAEEEENLAMKYAMSDMEADYEEDMDLDDKD